MTLEDLKKRATASELTLIEATEAALRASLTAEMKKSVKEFIMANNPPSRDEVYRDQGAYPTWFARMDRHLNPDAQ